MKITRNLALCAAAATVGTGASANTLQLNGFTSSIQTVNIQNSPVPNTPSRVGASGFEMTDTTGDLGDFIAWCVDVAHWLMPVGNSQDYNIVSDPWSNSYGLSDKAEERIQALFDANYGSLDTSNGDQAAAFQIALWESAFEGDLNTPSMTDDLFQATSSGSTALANTYLANAASYGGPQNWKLTFLEVDGYDADRASNTGQNLVTVSAVPLPAGGLLLITGFGMLAIRRRR